MENYFISDQNCEKVIRKFHNVHRLFEEFDLLELGNSKKWISELKNQMEKKGLSNKYCCNYLVASFKDNYHYTILNNDQVERLLNVTNK